MNDSAHDMKRTNATSDVCYAHQGPGVGTSADALRYMENLCAARVSANVHCLDVGFGKGYLIDALIKRRVERIHCVDIADASLNEFHAANAPSVRMHLLDCSHQPLPIDDDSVDFAFCTETIEHLSDPFFMVAHVKRVLKHGAYFTLSFPMPEDNLGYGGGQHAHIYPGFLQRASFEMFMRQMFFTQVARTENGSSAWYVFRNYKGEGVIDAFEIVSGNYDEATLFACLDTLK